MDIEERRKLFLRAMGQDPDQTEEAAPSEAPVSRGKNPSAARVSQPGRGRAAVRKTPAKRVRMTAAQRNPAEHAPVSSGRKNPVQRVQNPADRTKLPVNRVKTAKTAASGHPLDRLADSIRAVFSGMIPPRTEDVPAEESGIAEPAEEAPMAFRVPALEPEGAEGVVDTGAQAEEEQQMTLDDFAPSSESEEADLERLLAETKSERGPRTRSLTLAASFVIL